MELIIIIILVYYLLLNVFFCVMIIKCTTYKGAAMGDGVTIVKQRKITKRSITFICIYYVGTCNTQL